MLLAYRTFEMDRHSLHRVGNFMGADLVEKVCNIVNEHSNVAYIEVDRHRVWHYALGWADWWLALTKQK